MMEAKQAKSIEWVGDLGGHVALIEQTLLPEKLEILRVTDVETMWKAIRRLAVRGAPAIGIAAAMGVVLAVRSGDVAGTRELLEQVHKAAEYLRTARPTAVNLFWAVDRMLRCAEAHSGSGVDEIRQALLLEAVAIRDEDAAMCRRIGECGAPLIGEGCGILTHCNAGALATAELGTALAPMYVAHEAGRAFRVYADETRPLLQGARLTAWELQQAGIDVTLICDSMAAVVMRERRIDLVITGADRIAANGDAANKIGTYGVAVLAEAHGIPFYVAAPSSTFDLELDAGGAIPIEERDPDEIRCGAGRRTAISSVPCYNPAFDVTPARLIRGIITDRGIIEPVTREAVLATLASRGS
ncbi:MAG: S-methyl-5-thioribose-1-phosphate isomerase [bacterium]|nr:S-methyl-5-thioribose-1-phosphate isomerase [bacterium]